MASLTLTDISASFDVEFFEVLDHQVEIPVLAGLQAQGDLNILPLEMANRNGARIHSEALFTNLSPQESFTLIKGLNDHDLIPGPGSRVSYTLNVLDSIGLAVAAVVVEDGPAYIIHREHGATGIAPGVYIFRATREHAAEQRRVAD